MPQNANTECLYTTLKNVSGVEKFFGFIGARGKRLAADESVTVPGNLIDALGGGGKWSQRKFQALERAVDTLGYLEIVSTPSVHLYDPDEDRTRVLAFVGGRLGVTDPCWYSSGSSDFSVAP